jgi:hypothetical protein
MQKIKRICEERLINYKTISTTMYGKYQYSITVVFPFAYWRTEPLKISRIKPSNVELRKLRMAARNEYIIKRNQYISDITGALDHTIEYKISANSVTLYYETDDNISRDVVLLSSNPLFSMGLRIKMPFSDEQSDILLQNPDKIVRPYLWHNRYKFKAMVRVRFGDATVATALVNLFGGTLAIDNPRHQYYHKKIKPCIKNDDCRYTGGSIVYFKSETEKTLAQLALGDAMLKLEECVVL